MTAIKKKHLDRREWYSDSDRDFACLYHADNEFHGGIGLITFTGLKKPDVVDTPDGQLCIADKGYQWLELVPDDGHFALTAMFHHDILFQQYIDITLRNEVKKDGNAEFFDLLLDVVVLQDGTPRVVDAEELESALFSEAITRDEYELAKRTADKVVECWNANRALIEKKLYEYRALFGLKKKP
jgi:predicted RNA-binding protein associated with RNAse of E/G family